MFACFFIFKIVTECVIREEFEMGSRKEAFAKIQLYFKYRDQGCDIAHSKYQILHRIEAYPKNWHE